MRTSILFTVLSLLLFTSSDAFCDEASFTGKVTKDRVRMRLAPSLDSYIFKELHKDELVLVTGTQDDFYACMPPKELKGYIFRTYVLDGVVEGSNVNVRLEPDITSPVVVQLNTGDPIAGQIAAQNNKWLEISLPERVRFFVAKEFVTKAGDASLFSKREAQEKALQAELTALEVRIQKELDKPFAQIKLAPIATELNQIVQQQKDFAPEVEKAEALLAQMQKNYMAKSIASNALESDTAPAKREPEKQPTPAPQPAKVAETAAKPAEIIMWKDKEDALIQSAIESGLVESADDFYANELKMAVTQVGIIKPYNSYIKNRPGDFVLIDPKTNLPIAYLYSTKVDLQAYVNQTVSVQAVSRPNNYFAFPAFFVLKFS